MGCSAYLWRGKLSPEKRATVKARGLTLARSVGIFALGCGFAALGCAVRGTCAFVVPPLVAALTLLPAFHGSSGVKTP